MKLLDHTWRWKHGLYKIRSEDGVLPIRMRPEQQALNDLVYPAYFAKQKLDIIILKNRQRGTSTHCNLLCLDLTAYYPGKVANTLADTRERASTMFDNNVKLAFDEIHARLKPHAERDNMNELVFDRIRSKYIISASKSEPVDLLHVSEAPYFENEERITEAEQMLRRHGIEIMESTAYGVGNLFEKRFMEAWKAKLAGKRHHRTALFFPWYTDPKNVVTVHPEQELRNAAFITDLSERVKRLDGTILTPEQLHFYDQKFTDLDDEVFQFYPTEPEEAFLHSGRPVFNQEMLKALRETYAAPSKYVTEEGIEVWETAEEGMHYGIGVDTAEGLEHGDNSVISVVCKETGNQVARVAGKISAIEESELARLLSIVCQMYPEHLCVPERNNHGHTLIAFVKDEPHIRLYQRTLKDKITEKQEVVLGHDTNPRSKAVLIDTLKASLKDGTCVPRSHETYDQLRVFVHGERGTMAAIKGSHDDDVIALALANLGCQELIPHGSLDPSDYGIF